MYNINKLIEINKPIIIKTTSQTTLKQIRWFLNGKQIRNVKKPNEVWHIVTVTPFGDCILCGNGIKTIKLNDKGWLLCD